MNSISFSICRFPRLSILAASLCLIHSPAQAQSANVTIFLPHVRPVPNVPAPVTVSSVDADIFIEEQAARTTLTVTLRNPGTTPREGQMVLPVPHGAMLW